MKWEWDEGVVHRCGREVSNPKSHWGWTACPSCIRASRHPWFVGYHLGLAVLDKIDRRSA